MTTLNLLVIESDLLGRMSNLLKNRVKRANTSFISSKIRTLLATFHLSKTLSTWRWLIVDRKSASPFIVIIFHLRRGVSLVSKYNKSCLSEEESLFATLLVSKTITVKNDYYYPKFALRFTTQRRWLSAISANLLGFNSREEISLFTTINLLGSINRS